MRIISGTYRGKKIHPPSRFKARPTTDFAKESLFNILNNEFDLSGVEVLDLFSGTGSISYEFASRGARSVTAVELDQAAYRFISGTVTELKMDQVHILNTDVFRFLNKPYQSFDIIFADPPYDHPSLEKLPNLIFSSNILTENGLFILEHSRKIQFDAHPHYIQHRKYGGVNFSLFAW